MVRSVIIILGLACLPLVIVAQEGIDRIAFGSCSFQFGKQKIWKSVVAQDPDLWVWLGDNIYADTEDMTKMKSKYNELDTNQNYELLKAKCPIIATWDDHDFGENDAGMEYPKKKESQQLFLDFLKAGDSDPRRFREGVYQSYEYGAGQEKLKVILLDTRYHRSQPGAQGDMLGESQWQWLEQELSNSDATVTVIGSSIQFIAEPPFENWAKFPSSQDRMLKLIGQTGAKGVVFISGDVHFTEISTRKFDQVSYPIYDFTSSGLTHGNQVSGFKNPYRVKRYRYGYRNFGLIEFDWNGRKLTFIGFDRNGRSRFTHSINFSELGH